MPKGYHHLTQFQRCQIAALKESAFSISEIAKRLNVNKTSISRELKRNTDSGVYCHEKAQDLSEKRRSKVSKNPHKMTPENIAIIEKLLIKKLSPQQISGRLSAEGVSSVSPETIYKHVWKNKSEGGKLWKYLRHSGKKYNKRKGKTAGRGLIPNRVDISQRPKIVEEKSRIGDWEGDTIIGANHQGAILTLVDRATKYCLMEKLNSKQASEVNKAVERLKTEMERGGPIHTITWDNGKEFAGHEIISELTGGDCYFATPYHSWERGLNEHTNGLIRQDIPKGTEFKNVTNDEIKKIQKMLNTRPRNVLKYKTPEEAFLGIPITSIVALHS